MGELIRFVSNAGSMESLFYIEFKFGVKNVCVGGKSEANGEHSRGRRAKGE